MRLFAQLLKRLAYPFRMRSGNIGNSDILVTCATTGRPRAPAPHPLQSDLCMFERLACQLFIAKHRPDNSEFSAHILARDEHDKFGISRINFL